MSAYWDNEIVLCRIAQCKLFMILDALMYV
jgi:hypothetical protein